MKVEYRALLFNATTIEIDVSSRGNIYKMIHVFVRRKDKAVVFFLRGMDEILEIADRVLVMSKGRVFSELDLQTTTKKEIMKYSMIVKGA